MLDPSITLFGKRIQVNGELEVQVQVQDSPCSNNDSYEHLEDDINKELTEEELMENDQTGDSSEEAMDESTNEAAMSGTADLTEKAIDFETQEDENESNDTKKELKKPDKILPCPRCNSMDTKFCYYNNYNISQPRHFCKGCQRYWTAGGTMRNVPVGAGRRKTKSSASRYCHITVPEAFDVSNGIHHPGVQTSGTVLTFGSNYPICENGDDHSSGSTVTTSSMEDRSKKGVQQPKEHFNGFANQMQCFQWPYMWNPVVSFCPSAYPMPIYPHPYWNGAPIPLNGAPVPWVPTQKSPGSNLIPPTTLGKHTRDGEILSPSDNDRSPGTATATATTTTTSSVMRPKILRIDDPDEAAKSSIWLTLGIKKDKGESIRKGFFNSFQSKNSEKTDGEVEAPPGLIKANPVALCRSFSFQERA